MLDMPLSKSALQAGAQCPRMLWLRYNMGRFADLVGEDEADQEQFDIGNIVGEAAQGYFDDGETVVINTDRGFSPENYPIYARETAEYMRDPNITCIAEATFYTGDLVVFVDLLHRNPTGGWDIYEVKSTNRIGPVHVRDASWQTYVARSLCGVNVKNTYLMHPYAGWQRISARDYVDPDDFEVVDDFTDFIYNYSCGAPSPEQGWLNGLTIEDAIEYLTDMVTWEVPPACEGEPGYGNCCNSPYRCNYVGICQKMLEEEEAEADIEMY